MVSLAANVRPSPAGVLFILLVSIVCLLYVKDKFPKLRVTAPTDVISAVKNGKHGSEYIWGDRSVISLKRLLAVSIFVAEKGGAVLKEVREGSRLEVKSKGKTAEGANDPVTDGDIKSHRVMFGGLKRIWPNLNVISEEKERIISETKNSTFPQNVLHYLPKELKDTEEKVVPINDVTVWIDPLDATQEYTENLRKYVTTMVCIAVKGAPLIGIIHQPFLGKTYWAWVKVGHSPFTRDKANEDNDIKIIVSRSHAGSVKKIAEDVFGSQSKVISAGGAGYKSIAVASGLANVYVHVTAIKKWDICAGNALLVAMGGNMTDTNGNVIHYDSSGEVKLIGGLVASVTDHDKFVARFRKQKDN